MPPRDELGVTPQAHNLKVAGALDSTNRAALRRATLSATLKRCLSPLDEALGQAVLSSASALLADLTSGATLRAFYGTGFELASPINGALQKLEEVTYVFWFVTAFAKNSEKTTIKGDLPLLILKISYYSEWMIVRRLKMSWRSFGRGKMMKGWCSPLEVYGVPPLLGSLAITEHIPHILADEDVMSRTVCSCFYFSDGGPSFIRLDVGTDALRIVRAGKKTRFYEVEFAPEYFAPLEGRSTSKANRS